MEAKRKRVRAVAGLGGVTDEALRRICAAIREQPTLLGDASSRRVIESANMAVMGEIGQTDELPMKDGNPCMWHHMEPQALLRWCLENAPELACVFVARLRVHPCSFNSPWSLCFYCDEVTPGNMLRPGN